MTGDPQRVRDGISCNRSVTIGDGRTLVAERIRSMKLRKNPGNDDDVRYVVRPRISKHCVFSVEVD